MTDRDTPPTFGYLSMVSLAGGDAQAGPWVGGYLIVTAAGRPLEFHCTAPVVASRAQQILYGKSLRSFVFGEHLGAALVRQAKFRPSVLLVSDADAAAAGRAKKDKPLPIVLLPGEQGDTSAIRGTRLDTFDAEAWLLSNDQPDKVATLLSGLAAGVDLAEPFDRIHEAIAEAQQGVTSVEQGVPTRDAA